MITYKEKKKILDKINPFVDWSVIDRSKTIWRERPRTNYGAKKVYLIPYDKMERGDSVWIASSMLADIRKRVNRRKLIMTMLPPMAKVRIKRCFEKKVPGFRVYCNKPIPLNTNKPVGRLKIAV